MLKSSSLCLYSSNLGTFWLKIEQFWPFEEIFIFGIFYELWTFAYFDRLCKLEKRGGDEIKNKSSPLRLLSQSQPNFAEMIEEIFIFSHGGHLGYRTVLTDTILKGDHPRIISAKFGWDWLSSLRGEDLFLISSPPLFSNLHNRSK
jgi:hypothetical protein